MADKEITKKTVAKSTQKKDDKVSLDELKRRKEEVLARINEEIGNAEEAEKDTSLGEKSEEGKQTEDITDEVVVDEKDEFEKEMVEEDEKKNEDGELKKEENVGFLEKEEKKSHEVTESKSDEGTKDMAKSDEGRSAFSATEFGLSENKGNKSKNILLFVIVFLLVALFSAAFYFYFIGAIPFQPKDNDGEVVPTQSPTSTPMPVEFNRAELSVQVLNGSGVSGAAGAFESFLEGLGYKNIEIGNADNSDYEDVTIQIKEEYKEFFELITKDITESYVVNEDYEVLDENSGYDLIIIVGSKAEKSKEQLDE